jgi:uncharacterized protein involved in outer membrane biogenesis
VRRTLLVALGLILVLLVAAAWIIRSRLTTDSIKSTLEEQATAALGEPVRIGALSVRWYPRPGLTLERVTVGTSRAMSIDRLVVSTGLRPLLSRHIAEAEVLIEQSRLDAPRFLALLTSPARGSGSGSAQSSSSALPLTIDAIRSIALRNVSLVSGPRTILVNADLAYAGDRLDVQRLDAQSEITQLTATGAVTDLARRTCQLTIKARSLDLDALIEFLAPFASPSSAATAHGPGAPFDITAQIAANEGRAVGATFTDLSSTARVTNGQATLKNLRFQSFGGRAEGDVVVHTAGPQPQYEWRGGFSGLDMAKLLAFAGAPNAMTGTLQTRGSLRASGPSVQQAFSAATGAMQVVVRNGQVPGLDLVRTVVLAFGRPAGETPAGSGEAFSELAADVAFGGGRATTNNLTFASRDVDLRGAGSVDLRTQAINFAVDMLLSRELSAQAGRDLVRYAADTNGRVVLPGQISGTAVHPTIFIDPAKAMQRALANAARTKIKSLFDRIIR